VVRRVPRKIGEDEYARDLYWLGKWFNEALIAIETQGGGARRRHRPRDGRRAAAVPEALPAPQRGAHDRPDAKTFGYPMDPKNRALVVNQIEQWHVRDRNLPFVTDDLLYEMTEFVHHDVGTSPRARDGSRDDRVMAAAGRTRPVPPLRHDRQARRAKAAKRSGRRTRRLPRTSTTSATHRTKGCDRPASASPRVPRRRQRLAREGLRSSNRFT
jgi:hypothetical protein